MSKARKHPITDAWILHVVQDAGGLGHYDAEGHYGEAVIGSLDGRGQAQEYKSSLYRCAHYLARKGIAPVSISRADIRRIGGVLSRIYEITFRVSDKDSAKRHQVEAHGANPSGWAYNPANRNDPNRYRGG